MEKTFGDGANFLFRSLIHSPAFLLQSLPLPSPPRHTRWHPNLPVTHGSVGRLDDEGLLLAFPPQLLDVVLELGVLCGEDPGPGYEVVLLGLALAHSEGTKIN